MAEPVKIIAEEWDLETWLEEMIREAEAKALAQAQEFHAHNISRYGWGFADGWLRALRRVRQELEG